MKAFIVGCGRIAGGYNSEDRSLVLTHVMAYRHLGIDVVGCCDLDADRAGRFAAEWGIKAHGSNLGDLLRETSPDVVSDCTPPAGRLAVIDAARACPSVRSMVIEKPLGQSGADARAVAAVVQSADLRAVVNYFRAFDPFYRQLAHETRQAPHGALMAASCLYYGAAHTNASHLVERIIDMMGAPASVRRTGGSDVAPSFELSFTNGAVARLTPAPSVEYSPLEMDLLFERARIRVIDGERRVERFALAPDPMFPGYSTLVPAPPGPAPSIDAFLQVFRTLLHGQCDVGAVVQRAVLVTEILEEACR